ncbi:MULTISPECIES: hypothetical protein [unclassified Arcicella]|uniref:hypothetical protein n=1 Tax=unclassified Arcicella TaxID=2644986 RepID=UPI002857AD51|nr:MULTISPECIES: hypothetical protein [unclassified Arcicella]MDR6564927.1 hypothetical protein [Arcicella sp. BE51]MDR6814717.1 hypothetical protein [Arcicella sp. BE140]MDR6826163.1 hypothetical protein [Arcicella sp. BE139]
MKKLHIKDYQLIRIDRTMAMALRKYRALRKPLAFEFQIELNPSLSNKIDDASDTYLDACNKRRKVMLENDDDLPF